jgi:hypothetical protein
MRALGFGFVLLVAGALSGAPDVRAQVPAAPAGEPGTVSGVVLDKATGDPIIEATVEVVGGEKKVQTDLDGRFRFELPPGGYELRISAPLYQPVRLQGVHVKPHEVTKANTSLVTAKGNVQVVEVVAQANRASEATQLTERKKSAVVSETVGAETIAKEPAKDAAEVVKRTPAVTIKDNRFIYVRGLGERYSSALLAGSRLPSPDPDRRVVPLDLFPAEFIESLAVIKTYTPDLPADFSGGLVDIHTREFPDQFTFSTGVSTGFNTQTTFQDFNYYRGSNVDYFGLGGDFRELPDTVPNTKTFQLLSQEAKNELGRQFKDIWNTHTTTAPPNSGFNIAAGDTWGPLGVTFGGIYTTEYQKIPDWIENQYVNGGATQPVKQDSHFILDNSLFKTRLGGLLTATYKVDPDNKFFLRTLIDQNSFNLLRFQEGKDTQGTPQQTTTLQYTQEQLAFGQIGGQHHWAGGLFLDWRTAYSRTLQSEPDTRYVTYEGTPPSFTDDSLGGSRIFNSLSETLSDSSVDFTIPFTRLPFTDQLLAEQAKLKFGPAYSFRDRSFDQRRFVYNVNSSAFDLTQPPETILDPGHLIPGLINFDENTQSGDSYDVSQQIAAGYAMLDLPLIPERLRLVGGARLEYSYISLRTFAIGESGVQKVFKNNLDWLPGVNLIYSPRDDMNIRGAYSQSVSRPEFRELSPTQYPAPRGLRPLIGNPNLVEAHIENFDLRWEWFLSPLELVSASFFHKNLQQPIEQTVIVESSAIANSFANAENGELTGFEFEGRKDFGFLSPRLSYLSLLANVAIIDANVNIPRAKTLQVQTSTSRPLQGQAPDVINAALDWTHPVYGTYRLLYYAAGPIVSAIGSFGLPDIIEQSRNQLDAVAIFPIKPFGIPLTTKLSAENLLNDRFLFTQAGQIQREYKSGVKISIGFAYTY